MRSQLQIEASRRNSKKSTGPRTAAGKAASSRNATTSGIFAEAEIIGDENSADLEALLADYVDRFHPDAPEQRCLVDILVHSEWTLRRLRRAEAQLWDKSIDLAAPSFGDENLQPLGRAVNYDESRVFTRLQHRINATQRNYQHALKDLLRLQANRPDRKPPATQPASIPLGFVSSPGPSPPPVPEAVVGQVGNLRPIGNRPADPCTEPPKPISDRPRDVILPTLSIMEVCPSALFPAC